MEPQKSSIRSRLALPLSIAGVASIFFAFVAALVLPTGALFAAWDNSGGQFASSHEIKKFSSYNEMTDFLAKAQDYFSAQMRSSESTYAVPGYRGDMPQPQAMAQSSAAGSAVAGAIAAKTSDAAIPATTPSFSTTNLQVTGVDEPDFLKNDGKYVYLLAGDRLTIIDGYPAKDARIVSKVSFDIPSDQSLREMFLKGDRLVMFYQASEAPMASKAAKVANPVPQEAYAPTTHVLIVDISDRTAPKLLRNFDVSGVYNTARMIGSNVFLLTVRQIDNYQNPVTPSVEQNSSGIAASPEIYYFDDPQQSYAFNTVSVFDLQKAANGITNGTAVTSKTFMIGGAATVYVSDKSMYIAYPDNAFVRPTTVDKIFPRTNPVQPSTESTIIHRISISAGSLLQYSGRASVPGHLLNQFSMGEYGGRFSIATTSSDFSQPYGTGFQNSVYTLDSSMNLVGKLTGLEKGESIYSARFMGDKLYLVTFRQLDPFLVIDLSRDQPTVLGSLQLPGFSNYLQPYDATHVIGIGRDAVPNAAEGNLARPMGLKVALFDVSDLSNPKLVGSYGFGDSQTGSEALYDHKALLFDKGRNLLVMPVSSPGYGGTSDGRYSVWSGFYVFDVSPSGGVKLSGTIEHGGQISSPYMELVGRSFFINDTLYTVSPGLMKMNEISSISHELNSIELAGSGGIIEPMK